jgi:hypothetical protein
MSDFRLKEIAFLAGKDARTIRRWCEEGLVRGAFRIGGKRGHWRIRSRSALEAAEQAAKAAEGFSRNRGKRWESAFRGFAKSAAKIQRKTRSIKLQADKIDRTARRTSRMLRPAVNALRMVSDDRLEKVGWSRNAIEAIRDKLMPEKTATKLIEAALLVSLLDADADSGKANQKDIAKRLGMTLRRFREDYSSHWNSAIKAFKMMAGISAADGGYVTDPDGDQCGEVGQIVFHESGTQKELRAWRSAALQLQGAGSDD